MDSTPNPVQPEREVDLGQLFSDVSRTVSGIRHMFNGDQTPMTMDSAASSAKMASPPVGGGGGYSGSSASPLAGLFGGQSTCFKTCGMEDIQYMARKAGELLITLRTCTMILTGVICLVLALMVLAGFFYSYRQSRSSNLSHKTDCCGREFTLTRSIFGERSKSETDGYPS